MSRLTSPVPKFWRKVQWVAGILTAVAGAAIPVLKTMPEVSPSVVNYMILASAVFGTIAVTAQFTQK